MSPYEITYPGGSVEHWNEKPGVFYINKLVNYFDKAVWLNPEQRQNWQYSHSTMILRDLVKKNMFQILELMFMEKIENFSLIYCQIKFHTLPHQRLRRQ